MVQYRHRKREERTVQADELISRALIKAKKIDLKTVEKLKNK